MTRTSTATESTEQQWLMRWAELEAGAHPELRLLFHIPNEGQRSRATGGRMKAEGLKKGVPDLFLPVARNGKHGLFIEMKREKGGRVSEAQREWMKALEEQGYQTEVCNGWETASQVLLTYLNARRGSSERGRRAESASSAR